MGNRTLQGASITHIGVQGFFDLDKYRHASGHKRENVVQSRDGLPTPT